MISRDLRLERGEVCIFDPVAQWVASFFQLFLGRAPPFALNQPKNNSDAGALFSPYWASELRVPLFTLLIQGSLKDTFCNHLKHGAFSTPN